MNLTKSSEFTEKMYPDNLCVWSWWKQLLFPVAYTVAENKARSAEWRLRVIESNMRHELPPCPPDRLFLKVS